MQSMNLRPHMITLGVKDIEKSTAFYHGFGLQLSKASEGDIALFDLDGIILALYPWEKLADDVSISQNGSGFQGITLSYNVRNGREVNEVMEKARQVGAKIVKRAQKAVWGGISGYFEDPDGHLWEVAYNPFWTFDEHGNIVIA